MAFTFSRAITVDHTKVPANLSSFQVLISGTYSFLKTTANGGDVQNASGYDIVFASDSSGSSQLPWEVVNYDPTTGSVEMWVRVNLSSTVDTVFYLCYGDASISSDQSWGSSAWGGDWEAVYHLPDGTTLSAVDSSGDGYDGTITGTVNAAAGQIDGGAEFPSSADGLIDIGDQGGVGDTYAFQTTLSFWIASNSGPVNAQILSKSDNSTMGFFVRLEGTKLSFILVRPTTNRVWYVASAIPADGSLNYVSITYTGHTSDGSSGALLYLNGSLVSWDSYTDGSGSFSSDSGSSFQIGGSSSYTGANGRLDGVLDEVRYLFGVAPPEQVAAEYNNQSDPSSFYTVGSATVPAPTINYFFASPSSYIGAGSSTLSWDVSNSTSVSISTIGTVVASGTQVVSPTSTITYTLTATNAGGTTTATTTVTVVGEFVLLKGPVSLPALQYYDFRKSGAYSSPSNENKKAVICIVWDDIRVVSPAAHLSAIVTTDAGATWIEVAGPAVYCKANSQTPILEPDPYRMGENIYIMNSLTLGLYALLKFSFASLSWTTLNANCASYLAVTDDPAHVVTPNIVVNELGYGMGNITDGSAAPAWTNQVLLRFKTDGSVLGTYQISEPDSGWNNGNPGFRGISQLSNPNYFVGVNTDQSFTTSVIEGDGFGDFRERTLHFTSDTSSYSLSLGVPTFPISLGSGRVIVQLGAGNSGNTIAVNMMAIDGGANQPFSRNELLPISGNTAVTPWGWGAQRGSRLFIAAAGLQLPNTGTIVAQERDASNNWLTAQTLATDTTGKIQNISTFEFSSTMDMLTASSDGHSGSFTDYPYYDMWYWQIEPPPDAVVVPTGSYMRWIYPQGSHMRSS